MAHSPAGQRIVTSGEDMTAKVWEATSGRELLTLRGHIGSVTSVAFSPDGQRMVTGGSDNTPKVWQTARVEQVVAWQEEEQAAERLLATRQLDWAAELERQRTARTRDEGAIKRWLILGPIPLGTGKSNAQGLDSEQIEGEGRLQPKAGETRSTRNGESKWQEASLTSHAIDFNAILGRVSTHSAAYAVCYMESEIEQRGLRLLVGHDDDAKVYLNGKQIYKFDNRYDFLADRQVVLDIALNAGLNVLVFKVVNKTSEWKYSWKGSIRFTDAQGNPVKGIKVTLTP